MATKECKAEARNILGERLLMPEIGQGVDNEELHVLSFGEPLEDYLNG